jgi:anti-sigma factor RsiW
MSRVREEDLHAFVDGQLDDDDAAQVLAHLEENPDAHARVLAYIRQKALVRAALEQLPAAAERRSETADRREPAPPRRPWAERMRRMAAAAVLVGVGWSMHTAADLYREWRVPPVVEAATQAHQVFGSDGVRPVELPASAWWEMRAWFEQHLDTPVDIPDLSAVGLRFVGGRLLASGVGPMAQLLYEDADGQRLTVYLTKAPATADAEVQIVKVAHFAAGYWKEGDLTYTIVAEMEAEALRALAFEIHGSALKDLL